MSNWDKRYIEQVKLLVEQGVRFTFPGAEVSLATRLPLLQFSIVQVVT